MDAWWQTAAAVLKEHGIAHVSYVPDNMLHPLINQLEKDSTIRPVLATREEEAVGICAGMFLGGGRPVLLMQSSGFGNTLNAIGSLLIPYQIPLLMIVSMRGESGEWNVAQSPLGRGVRRIMDALNIQHFDIDHAEQVAPVLSGAAELCFKTRVPVAVLVRPSLVTGGK